MMRFQWAIRRVLLIIFTFSLIFYTFWTIFANFQGESTPIDYPEDFDAEKDEIFVKNYLKQMQLGRARVRSVVEPTQIVEENIWCFLKFPTVRKSGNWLKMAGIYVYSAYFDDRENSLFPENSAVQILAMSNHTIEGKIQLYCNLFTKSTKKYTTVKAYIREIWQRGWDPRDTFQMPNLITCPIPQRLLKASDDVLSVSLSRRRCYSAPEAMEVVMKPEGVEGGQNKKNKKKVAVCVKGLDYQEDISFRLLEWIEMQYYLGADSVSIYHFFLTDTTKKVLDWYQKNRNLEVIPLSLPPGNPNDPKNRSNYLKSNRPAKRRHELLPYNDCFYRHIHTHQYVLIIDIDEVIVPIDTDNYSELLESYETLHGKRSKMRISSISGRNVFKLKSNFSLSAERNYMISNGKRSRKTSPNGEYGKSFSSTSSVASVFNHFALHKLSPSVAKSQFFPESMALKLHYKSECPWEYQKNECHQLEYDVIDDTSLDRFKDEFRRRVDKVVMEIGLN